MTIHHTTRVPLKSLLFVPGDSEKKMVKATATRANCLILDLEDSVHIERINEARGLVHEYLLNHKDRQRQQVWVRINALSSVLALPDLVAVAAAGPDGIMLPKVESSDEVIKLDHYLTILEEREGLTPQSIRILPVATETPAAVFALQTYRGCSSRLAGLTWGAEDLSVALGATTNLAEDGEYEFTYKLARSMCLLASHSAGVEAIEGISSNFRNPDTLLKEARASRRAGFTGKMAIHPDQVDPINIAFTPDEAEISHAKAVIEAFHNGREGAGVAQLNGKMIDRPHLTQALRLLATSGGT